ncbi:hypothetical protein MMC19_004710 [Ptychographa xylographoides]|nr:hypothetical protein [Ptychographa xylographoides]
MAQKAAKQQASRNTAILKRVHLASLGFNALFLILRLIIFRSSCTRAAIFVYVLLSAPAFAIEFWLETIGRPKQGANGELKSSGDDLEAKGLTEYMFDVLYWSWGTTFLSSVIGDKAWWAWMAIPIYSAYLAFSTFGSMRQGMAGLTGQGGEGEDTTGVTSNRQKKLEKRGGQKVQYR